MGTAEPGLDLLVQRGVQRFYLHTGFRGQPTFSERHSPLPESDIRDPYSGNRHNRSGKHFHRDPEHQRTGGLYPTDQTSDMESYQIDLSDLAKGIYFVRIQCGQETGTGKLILK